MFGHTNHSKSLAQQVISTQHSELPQSWGHPHKQPCGRWHNKLNWWLEKLDCREVCQGTTP